MLRIRMKNNGELWNCAMKKKDRKELRSDTGEEGRWDKGEGER